ncbi:hypothetical protein QYE76_036030 [Lolium multiflorum]|uniref:Uncharacterized protein n=1 Tax=Lolium multiflorum TaxID=4521 RepID=A0AAD8R207_LOLMU|nr:hypothetical protein QYE76_036030 [Lolium multiflorum]
MLGRLPTARPAPVRLHLLGRPPTGPLGRLAASFPWAASGWRPPRWADWRSPWPAPPIGAGSTGSHARSGAPRGRLPAVAMRAAGCNSHSQLPASMQDGRLQLSIIHATTSREDQASGQLTKATYDPASSFSHPRMRSIRIHSIEMLCYEPPLFSYPVAYAVTIPRHLAPTVGPAVAPTGVRLTGPFLIIITTAAFIAAGFAALLGQGLVSTAASAAAGIAARFGRNSIIFTTSAALAVASFFTRDAPPPRPSPTKPGGLAPGKPLRARLAAAAPSLPPDRRAASSMQSQATHACTHELRRTM